MNKLDTCSMCGARKHRVMRLVGKHKVWRAICRHCKTYDHDLSNDKHRKRKVAPDCARSDCRDSSPHKH